MEVTTDTRITVEAILKAVEQGAKSPTAVAKFLGFKSGSSSVIKRLIIAVPDLQERLALNASKTDVQPVVTDTPVNAAAYPIPDCVPFRASSGYAMVWAILYAHRAAGINKADLTAKYKAWSGKPDKNCGYDVHVVLSPKQDGTSHRSAYKAAQTYWVEEAGQSPSEFIDRHLQCDWGEVCEEDSNANDRALTEGTRLLSAYRTSKNERIWVITEWDRSVTTLLLPDEY